MIWRLILAVWVLGLTASPALAVWDKGFNFRSTSGYVADTGVSTYVVCADIFPITRNTVDFGWVTTAPTCANTSTGVDVRLAGHHRASNNGGANQRTFRVTLPATGTYTISLALGTGSSSPGYQYIQILDSAAPVLTIDDTNGTVAWHFDDALGVDLTNTTWPGSNASKEVVFASTTMNVVIGKPTAGSDDSALAHLCIHQGTGAADCSVSGGGGGGGSAGTTYYVATTGSDANPGTEALPWRHLCYAIGGTGWIWNTGPADRTSCATTNPTKLAAGDTLFVRGGTYQEYFIAISSQANIGTAANPITIKAYPGETPIVDGGFTNPPPAPALSNSKAIFWINNGRNYWTIDGLEIKRGLTSGIFIGDDALTSNIVVSNNNIHSIVVGDNTPCVYISTYASAVTVDRNRLHSTVQLSAGTPRGTGVEIFVGSNNHIITNNEIYGVRIGIYYKHGAIHTGPFNLNTTLVENNVIHDLPTAAEAGGSIRAIETMTDGMIIRNNLIYNIGVIGSGSGEAINVYGDELPCERSGAFWTQILHNTIVNPTTAAIELRQTGHCPGQGARYTTIRDNVIYKTSTDSTGSLAVWPDWTSSQPVLWHTPWTIAASSPNNALLVRPTAGYFSGALDFYTWTSGAVGGTEPAWTSCVIVGCTLTDGAITWIAGDKAYHQTTSNYNLWYSADTSLIFRLYNTTSVALAAWRTATAADPASPGYPSTGQDLNSLQAAPVFEDYAGGDYRLATGSPGENAASDGTDMGANLCAVGRAPTCTASTGALLVVTPDAAAKPYLFVGPREGPFSAHAKAFTIINAGTTSMTWTASSSQPWATLSLTGGTLAANASVVVTVTAVPLSTALLGGTADATITFTNTSTGIGNTTRTVKLAATGRGYGGVR